MKSMELEDFVNTLCRDGPNMPSQQKKLKLANNFSFGDTKVAEIFK